MSSVVNEITEEFQCVLDALIERELLIDSNPLLVQSSSEGTRISWASSAGLSYLFSEYSTFGQYIETLNQRDFNLCFFDGGLVQINYFVENDEIVAHRLCYVPCPFNYVASEWEEFSLCDIPSLMSASDLLQETRLASPVRFDFDKEFSDDRHAHSHVSLNKQSCRIPTYGPVSLGHFFRFILRYFYEEQFDADMWWADLRPRLYTRTLDHPSPHEIHIESAVGFE